MIRPDAILRELGERIRKGRRARALTLTDLAERSGLSRRYLTEAEAGRANLSIIKLARIAAVIGLSLGELCDIAVRGADPRRIALVGLRGAGKTTVGRRLALELEVPFVELDRLIEERGGLALADIFSLDGEATYARLEREALEEHLRRTGSGVLATGGSLVMRPETWRRLRETCFTVWLRARPEDHWSRVTHQGDTRPMRENPRAMEELRSILVTREALYREAHLEVDTSSESVEETCRLIRAAVTATE